MLEVSSRNIPYTAEPGTYEQLYTIDTPHGKLTVRTNVDSGKISYVPAAGDHGEHALLVTKSVDGPSPSSFYGQDIGSTKESATVFHDGDTDYVPVEANPGGNCNAGNAVYIVKWPADGPPAVSGIAAPDDQECLRADYVNPAKSGFEISILAGDDLEIETWRYDGSSNRMTPDGAVFHQDPAGFIPLVSRTMPVVKSLHTRFGMLTLRPNSGILLNGVVQNFPGDAALDDQGFAAKLIRNGGQDIVIALSEPDNATGLVFQILAIDATEVHLSRYFGSGFADLGYRISGATILFDVGDYAPHMPDFSNQHFQLADGNLTSLDAGARVVPSNNLPTDIRIVSGD